MAKKLKIKKKCDECGETALLEVEIGDKIVRLCGSCAEDLEGLIRTTLDEED